MLFFPEEFFQEEEKCGYKIPAKMKHIWAEELEMLFRVDRICRKYGIKYSAYYGTLLGAVRHQGFIPWDDDVDLCMPRKDYERFISVLPKEEPSWVVYYSKMNEMRSAVHASIMNSKEIRLDKEYLEDHHGCPYIVGFDIFPLDAVPDDEGEFEAIKVIYDILYRSYFNYDACLESGEIEENIGYIEEFCHYKIDREADIKLQIWNLLLTISTIYNDLDFVKMQFYPSLVTNWMSDRNFCISKKSMDEGEYVNFENIQVLIPAESMVILEKLYGENYMTPIRGGRHTIFEKQDEIIRNLKTS